MGCVYGGVQNPGARTGQHSDSWEMPPCTAAPQGQQALLVLSTVQNGRSTTGPRGLLPDASAGHSCYCRLQAGRPVPGCTLFS